MQITLTQPEIETALRNYLNQLMTLNEGTSFDIEFTSGRKENGTSATIDIQQTATPKASAPVAAPVTRTAAAPEPVEEVAEEQAPEAPAEEPVAEEAPKRSRFGKRAAENAEPATDEVDASAEESAEAPKKKSMFLRTPVEAEA